MSIKKLLILAPAALMALASCGGGTTPAASSSQASSEEASSEPAVSSEQSSVASSSEVGEKTKISFWTNSSYTDVIDGIIAGFQKEYPNIEVTHSKKEGNYDTVKNLVVQGIPADNYPDMFLGYPDAVQEVMQYNKVVKLDKYIDDPVYGLSDDEYSDYLETFIEEGQNYPIAGTYSLPLAKSTEALYYNKQLLTLDLSSIDPSINDGNPINEEYLNNLTWEVLFGKLCPALVAYNEAITDETKRIYDPSRYDFGAVFGYDSDDNLFITLAEQYGYPYTSVDTSTGKGSIDFVNDGMKSVLKTFNKAKNDGYFITQGVGGNYTNYAFTARAALFTVGSTGGTKYQISTDFETGVAKIPHAEGRDAKVINQGPSVCILKHGDADRELATWLFYKYFTNAQNSLVWAVNTGYSPIRYSNYTSPEYIAYSSIEGKPAGSSEKLGAEVAHYVGDVTKDYFSSPVFKGSSEARLQVKSLVTELLKLSTDEYDNKVDGLFETAKANTLKAM
ncbi:MAG: extracellular solute-binding protein [Bacilli bacterium]|nr:extracellular solute-binding protein [Bacilli bacterium]